MPQITVDYSQNLESFFDRQGFALALHPLIAETAEAQLAACKTRFRRVDETVVAAGTAEDAVVHIGIALLPGRTPEVKAQLSEVVLDLLAEYLRPAGDVTVVLSAEVRELDASYRRR
ncbi:5-carboxymethyl-2-hydroxymuconate Delta-isomerase [Streptomyces sp. NPDC002889]|uniref:5-carboxymethyl-2-hydroxymuconate Delta-isomerase n=1 Tax=Streptomyces sp. NPDC002889 TaxID=3364669 RepID=UPI0036887A21